MVISLPKERDLIQQILLGDLPVNWRRMLAYSELQRLGSEWYERREALILEVPSAVVPKERNYIINAEHPDFSTKIKLLATEDYFWDARLV